MKTTFIYALIDPRDNQVKYIGKSNNPERRLYEHLASLSKRNKKTNWIRNLKKISLTPELFILDKVNEKEWQFWEQHYISLYKSWNFNLKNNTRGGEGPDEIIAWKISQTLKRTKQSKETINKRLKSRREYKEKTGNWAKPRTYEKVKITRIANDSYRSVWTKELRSKQSNSIKEAYKNGTKILSGGCLLSRKGKDNPLSRAIVQYSITGNIIAEHDTVSDAFFSITGRRESHSGIQGCCKGRNLSVYNYIWRYKFPKPGEPENITESILKTIDLIKEKKQSIKQNMKEQQKLRWKQ